MNNIPQVPLQCMVISISDTRTEKTDLAGDRITEQLEKAGHHVRFKEIIKEKPEAIRKMIDAGTENPEIDVVITNGGTGLSTKHTAIETIGEMLEKEMSGFASLFQTICYEEAGTAAIRLRAAAGVRKNTAIFALPGAVNVAELATGKIILPELTKICHDIKKDIDPEQL
ncbi:MogA/MoaB family molybdenum cofactor biosynthesis protein [Oceanobacillus damuensis]|uniref:MogA/MoaB family molybdenum cofactor biosynthesis protein n=1 Tax=Oceanobacillus damuensis TaxID=937928 RepID=UPI00082CF7F2|nr:molybdenum cofactor synthesis domain-containing protein [Oceanobacillus damuensis]